MVLFGTALICLATLISDTYFRPLNKRTGQMIQALNLSNLSIIGSGQPLRHPEGIIASVNLNFSPYFCYSVINPQYLILNPPRYSTGHAAP